MIMNGSSAEVSSHASSGPLPRRTTSAHVMSRSRFGYARPSRSAMMTVVTVGAQETTALNDIVKNFFGLGATGASTDVGFGALEIRPIDSASLQTFAASRTYASIAGGTLGQYIAAIPFSKFASQIQSPVIIPGDGTVGIGRPRRDAHAATVYFVELRTMNKRKKVAWRKHRVKAKKSEEKMRTGVVARRG